MLISQLSHIAPKECLGDWVPALRVLHKLFYMKYHEGFMKPIPRFRTDFREALRRCSQF